MNAGNNYWKLRQEFFKGVQVKHITLMVKNSSVTVLGRMNFNKRLRSNNN